MTELVYAVSCRFAPLPPPTDPRERHPVPGTTVLRPVDPVEKWYGLEEVDGLRFCGWLIELEVLGRGRGTRSWW